MSLTRSVLEGRTARVVIDEAELAEAVARAGSEHAHVRGLRHRRDVGGAARA